MIKGGKTGSSLPSPPGGTESLLIRADEGDLLMVTSGEGKEVNSFHFSLNRGRRPEVCSDGMGTVRGVMENDEACHPHGFPSPDSACTGFTQS